MKDASGNDPASMPGTDSVVVSPNASRGDQSRKRDWFDQLRAFTSVGGMIVALVGLSLAIHNNRVSSRHALEMVMIREEGEQARSRQQADSLLDQAWDLLGGQPFTDTITSFESDPTRLREAYRLIRQAEGLTPSYAKCATLTATYLLASGRFDDAVAALDRAIELDPEDPVVYLQHAFALLEVGRTDLAL